MIETGRLILREWRGEDAAAFQAINSDPLVMATLGPLMTYDQTAAVVSRCQADQARDGHCFWALERRENSRLIGWCGLIRGTAGPVTGKPELGWRLASDCWGHGYASEAARGAKFERHMQFTGEDGKVRVRAVTQWAIIDKAAGRPIRVPPEVVAPFMNER